MTLRELVDELTVSLNLTPEQQFRVTAKIKRLIHSEKFSVYMRYAEYANGRRVFVNNTDPNNPEVSHRLPAKDSFLLDALEEKRDTHLKWVQMTDEEIVTWDIGTHKYNKGSK